jgi:hypothetical protein
MTLLLWRPSDRPSLVPVVSHLRISLMGLAPSAETERSRPSARECREISQRGAWFYQAGIAHHSGLPSVSRDSVDYATQYHTCRSPGSLTEWRNTPGIGLMSDHLTILHIKWSCVIAGVWHHSWWLTNPWISRFSPPFGPPHSRGPSSHARDINMWLCLGDDAESPFIHCRVLYPGGGSNLRTSGYARAAKKIFQLAMEVRWHSKVTEGDCCIIVDLRN